MGECMKKRKDRFLFLAIKAVIRFIYRKTEISGMENIPESNAIIVANHCKMNGPICAELFMPDNSLIWCAGEMMNLKEVPAYAYKDFWSHKSKAVKPFFKLLSYIIAPLSVCVFRNARTVAVYHDARAISTFKTTVKEMRDGKIMVIFPERQETNNNIVNMFQEKFVDVAKLYCKTGGKGVSFVPMYNAPTVRKMCIGKAIEFNPDADIETERMRICTEISESITQMARELPEHIVIPYNNIPKKNYITNKDVTEVPK